MKVYLEGKITRVVSFEDASSKTVVSINDYINAMKAYGQKKSQTVRSSRRYLRSLGMDIKKNGGIVIKHTIAK